MVSLPAVPGPFPAAYADGNQTRHGSTMNLSEQIATAPLWVLVALAMVTALGGAGGIGALLLSRVNGTRIIEEARKLKADAAKVVAEAATTLVGPLEARLGKAEAEIAEMRAELTERDGLIDEHSGWDFVMEQIATESGRPFPPRPPLRPTRCGRHS